MWPIPSFNLDNLKSQCNDVCDKYKSIFAVSWRKTMDKDFFLKGTQMHHNCYMGQHAMVIEISPKAIGNILLLKMG